MNDTSATPGTAAADQNKIIGPLSPIPLSPIPASEAITITSVPAKGNDEVMSQQPAKTS
jgi:hypothetical protein